MTGIVARPPNVPVTVWLGSTHTVRFVFPDEVAVSDEWTAQVVCDDGAPDELTVTVEDNTLSVTFEPPVTDMFDMCCVWTLSDPDGEVRIVGDFATTTDPGPSTTEVTVVCGDSECEIVLADVSAVQSVNGQTGHVLLTAGDVGADPAGSAQAVADDLTAHEALTIQGDGAHGGPLTAADVGADPTGAAQGVQDALDVHEAATDDVHGTVTHRWGPDDWGVFTIIVRTPDPVADWVRTVENGRGVVTSVQPAGGANLRTMSLHPDTDWADGEIRSLIYAPSHWTGNNTQMGHIHRARLRDDGFWEGINIWTSIAFGNTYELLHVGCLRNDLVSTSSLQSATDNDTGPDAAWIDRRSGILAHRRFNFGLDFIEVQAATDRGLHRDLNAGDEVTIDQMTDATFNVTQPLNNNPSTAARGVLQMVDPVTSTAAPWTADLEGRVWPTGLQAMKRWAPFWLATRVRGGTTTRVPVEIKRWRPDEPEPGWGDPRVRRVDCVPNADVPEMALGPGLHGILDAHLHSDTSQYWGDLRFRELN